MDGLQQASHAVAETLYKAQAQAPPASGAQDGTVVDAEVVDK